MPRARISKRTALEILIRHSAANIAGVGCGIRTLASREECRKVRDAIARVYPDVYGRELDDRDARNLHLP